MGKTQKLKVRENGAGGGGGGGGAVEKGRFQVRAFSIPADPIISKPGTGYIMS